jgi:hypothetical protein
VPEENTVIARPVPADMIGTQTSMTNFLLSTDGNLRESNGPSKGACL